MRRTVIFEAPQHVRVVEREEPVPGPDQLLVEAVCSAISAGTEGLLYRGEMPRSMMQDAALAALQQESGYPMPYGYATVGTVVDVGTEVDAEWEGRQVFAFHPHDSLFTATPAQVLLLPDTLAPEDAVFIPNMETAVTLTLDAHPRLGEHVAVTGAGIVGLLTLGLLSRFPVSTLLSVEPQEPRQTQATAWGADASVAPDEAPAWIAAHQGDGADLLLEVSGTPTALNESLSYLRHEGRLIVGSWYGTKSPTLDLGLDFHRKRLTLKSSQVSTLPSALTGRWTKSRRLKQARHWVETLQPSTLISHRLPVEKAASAYERLADRDVLQIVFTY
ncbi:MAG: zinc-binding dehydrogenase [Bacteroidetes bacterium]|jgi:2-desacetyl-2-hydroxyethyl bacteriochlorophyllide A dehydrogenase|nr:zinc-binding dehydrogenase [Bacteroidota bacterium]